MEEILQNLANLQFIDSRIDEIERLRGDLPDEIYDIETNIARLEAHIKKTEEELSSITGERSRLDIEIDEAKALIDKYDKQQLTVRNNREYDALTKEIDAQKQRIDNHYSRIREIDDSLDGVIHDLEDSKADLADTKMIFEEKKKNLDVVISKTEAEEEKLRVLREEAASQLSDRYLRSYNRLRNGLANKIAVVSMERGAALGTQLPPQMQVEVRKKTRIIIDESSGRIVLDPDFFEAARKQFTKLVS